MVVAADAHAMDSFRLAAQHSDELAIVFRCRAQAAAMMRQHRSIRLMLEREQMMRLAAEAPAPAVSRDAPPQAAPEPAPPRNAVFEAEIYAITHLDDAARIRANGRQGLPLMTGLDPAVPPPDPFFAETLVNGVTPALRELDAIAREPAEAA